MAIALSRLQSNNRVQVRDLLEYTVLISEGLGTDTQVTIDLGLVVIQKSLFHMDHIVELKILRTKPWSILAIIVSILNQSLLRKIIDNRWFMMNQRIRGKAYLITVD